MQECFLEFCPNIYISKQYYKGEGKLTLTIIGKLIIYKDRSKEQIISWNLWKLKVEPNINTWTGPLLLIMTRATLLDMFEWQHYNLSGWYYCILFPLNQETIVKLGERKFQSFDKLMPTSLISIKRPFRSPF